MTTRATRLRFPFFAALLLLLALSLGGCQLLDEATPTPPGSGLPTATAVAETGATGGATVVPVRTTPGTGAAPAASASPAARATSPTWRGSPRRCARPPCSC
jgi:hypothetical protein